MNMHGNRVMGLALLALFSFCTLANAQTWTALTRALVYDSLANGGCTLHHSRCSYILDT